MIEERDIKLDWSMKCDQLLALGCLCVCVLTSNKRKRKTKYCYTACLLFTLAVSCCNERGIGNDCSKIERVRQLEMLEEGLQWSRHRYTMI